MLHTAYCQLSYPVQDFWARMVSCSRRQIVKLYILFKTQDPENHTLLSGTYLFRPNKEVPPPGGKI